MVKTDLYIYLLNFYLLKSIKQIVLGAIIHRTRPKTQILVISSSLKQNHTISVCCVTIVRVD